MATDRSPFAYSPFGIRFLCWNKMTFRLLSSFLCQHLICQILDDFFGPSRRSRHASYTLVYPAWFLLLYFYYCNMLSLLFSLQQLDQLLAEQSHLFSELGLSDWKGERKAQNKQVPPGAADTAHPQSGHSKMVLQRVPSKNTMATGSDSALRTEAPPVQLPTRTPPEVNSAKPIPQDLCTSKQEIKGPPQAKMGFKAFIHNIRRCFSLTSRF